MLHWLGQISVGPSKIHGRGVFATGDLPPNTDLGVAQFWQDGWQVTNLGAMHNHSSSPSAVNVMTAGRERHLFTSRFVRRGEEITVDFRKQPDLEQPGPGWVEGLGQTGLPFCYSAEFDACIDDYQANKQPGELSAFCHKYYEVWKSTPEAAWNAAMDSLPICATAPKKTSPTLAFIGVGLLGVLLGTLLR